MQAKEPYWAHGTTGLNGHPVQLLICWLNLLRIILAMWCFRQCFSNFSRHQNHLEGMLKPEC